MVSGKRRFPLLIALVLLAFPTSSARSEPVTFAAFGDYGGGSGSQRVAEMVKGWNPDFIITTGDNNYGDISVGSVSWEDQVGRHYGDYILGRADNKYPRQRAVTQRFFPTVGNHDTTTGYTKGLPPDYPAGDKPGYVDYFHDDPARPDGRLPAGVHLPQQTFYSFRWGPVQLFSLDSDRAQSDPASMVEQQAWLQAGLQASNAPWKFVYFHHPPYSSGPHGNHSMMQWPFREWGADALFSGHDHNYERTVFQDFPYFVTGLGGQEAYGFSSGSSPSDVRFGQDNGAMRITVDEESALFEFFATNIDGGSQGRPIDRFVLTRSVPEPATTAPALIVLVVAFLVRLRRVI